MSLVRVVEVSAESPYGYDDAGRQAVKRAARTHPNVSAMWLKEVEPVVRTNAAAPFRVKVQIAYVLQERGAAAEAAWREDCASIAQAERRRGSQCPSLDPECDRDCGRAHRLCDTRHEHLCLQACADRPAPGRANLAAGPVAQ